MKKIKTKFITSINNKENKIFVSVAYAEKHVYLIDGKTPKIYMYDEDLKNYYIFNTEIIYCGICFDFNNKKILTVSSSEYNKIHILNLSFTKENEIVFKHPQNKQFRILNICYNTSRGKGIIIVTTNEEVLEIDSRGNILRQIQLPKESDKINFTTILNSLLIGLSVENNCINIFNDNGLLYHIEPPDNIYFLSIINSHYNQTSSEIILNVLAKYKNNCNYILCITIYQDDDEDMGENEKKNKIPELSEPQRKSKVESPIPTFPNLDRYINNLSHDPSAKYALIESIALIETSLSNILNEEGEKLQKAIKLSNNINDLLAVNSSVNETIKNITELEKVLISKLKEVVH